MDTRYSKARTLTGVAKRRHWRSFFEDRNVLAAGFGRRIVRGQFTDEPALVVYVARKVPRQFIPPSRLLPRRLDVGGDWLEVDVVETGPIYPLAFTARERPAPSGISVGHNISTGTLGCLVLDNTDNSVCILSNNHVLADQNAALIGDVVIQPGPDDGGNSPADDIANLRRFVPINAAGNTVDGAIAAVTNPANDVINQMKNNLMPFPNPDHPAVGLLFAGSCNRTIINPIRDVLAQLNIRFPAAGNSIVAAEVGMNVEKVGRTTEYTTSTITEIDLTVTLQYDFGPATFDRQIATAWMSEGGNSGSIVCRGGAGGNEDHCGCASVSAASQLLGIDLSMDQAVEREFRERYLSQTRVGRYAVDLYFRNEDKLVRRARETRISEADRSFARYLYDKYADDVRAALLQPHRSELRLTEEHLRDARQALGRVRQHLQQNEAEAAERLLEIVYEAKGRTIGEILKFLDDEGLLRRVREVVARVEFLEQPDR